MNAMQTKSWVFILLAAAASQVLAQNQYQFPSKAALRLTNVENFAVESFLETRTSGSIILTGSCVKGPYGNGISPDMLRVPDPIELKRIDDVLDRVSHSIAHYGWSRTPDGLVQLTDDRASADFLQMRLESVELTRVVNLRDAVDKLLKQSQIAQFLKQHQIDLEPVFTGASFWNDKVTDQLSQSPTAPKYTLKLTHVTLQQGLDQILRTFPGVWIYSECPGRITVRAEQL